MDAVEATPVQTALSMAASAVLKAGSPAGITWLEFLFGKNIHASMGEVFDTGHAFLAGAVLFDDKIALANWLLC